MSCTLKSIFNRGLAAIWRSVARWPLGGRTLGAWAPVVFARLREFGPYAMMELLLPGGSVLALTVWLYRRRKKVPALARSLNALL
jgi:hypothetical protein